MNIAMIFAGGSGVRMGAGVPKQFLEINGKPVVIHTLELFQYHAMIDKIYISVLEEYIDYMQALVDEYHLTKVAGIVPGGETAQDSIYHALKKAESENPPDSIVLLHDGVRPYVYADVITDNIRAVKQYGSAITGTPGYETVVLSRDGQKVDQVPLRKEIFTAQAPQSFYLKDILSAHDQIRVTPGRYHDMVDACTIMTTLGRQVHLVYGNRGNIKVTTPEDVYIFRGLLQYKENEQAFGFGLTNRIQAKMDHYRRKQEREAQPD
ncbi:MAG: 2-C-methyl-D-erythritol 4-phosphate cytidylyltransferase [Oscillospiraceae bacterium]|nr:2-C-methyl-D-erythritol 4-phosphate cytidylyltransferase [Oscillospiraceae bacterium]